MVEPLRSRTPRNEQLGAGLLVVIFMTAEGDVVTMTAEELKCLLRNLQVVRKKVTPTSFKKFVEAEIRWNSVNKH